MNTFTPKFTITNRMTAAITQIERARGFLEAARLLDDWVRDIGRIGCEFREMMPACMSTFIRAS